jgi:hypothetical protein
MTAGSESLFELYQRLRRAWSIETGRLGKPTILRPGSVA